MRRSSILVLLAAAALALLPGTAHAQRYFGGFTGYSYGEAAGNCPSVWNDCPERRTGYGIVAGGLSGGVFGLEQEYGWTNDIFGKDGEVASSKVTTLMTNFLAAIPIGPLRPYGAFGLGLTRTRAEFADPTRGDFKDTSFGRNYGVGILVLLPAHLGLRLDYRRFRSGTDIPMPGGGEQKLHFSRATIGLVLH